MSLSIAVLQLREQYPRWGKDKLPIGNEITLAVSGNLFGGMAFLGTDTIRVINTGK
jgi:hypothetical protein